MGKTQQQQEQWYPFPSVCAVFPCVQTMVRLPVLGTVNVPTQLLMHATAHRGLCGHGKKMLWKLTVEKHLLPHRGLEPASVLYVAFQSDAMYT